MRLLTVALVAALVLPAHALTPAEIAAGAATASGGVRTVVRRLAGENLRGRDNGTPESLKRLGPGLDPTKTGNDAYQQPFTFGAQQGNNLLAVIPGREFPNEFARLGCHKF
jgi:hypothetical protein